MSEFDNDIVGVRSRGDPMLRFYSRSNGIKLHGYKFLRSVKSIDPYGYSFDEYVHEDDYDKYIEAYKENGLL